MRKVGDLFEFVSADTGDCIIHGMMYALSDGVKWMPKHIALGSILTSRPRQATRSTLLVDLGYCTRRAIYSYDRQILKLDPSLAQYAVCS